VESSYDLEELKKLLQDENTRYITPESIREANKLGFSETEIIEIILSLKRDDFYKTMPAKKFQKMWQDVYKPRIKGQILYIKLQKSFNGKGVVISFKEK